MVCKHVTVSKLETLHDNTCIQPYHPTVHTHILQVDKITIDYNPTTCRTSATISLTDMITIFPVLPW